MNVVYIRGLSNKTGENNISDAIEEVFLRASNNLDWLKPGDLVLLKPALNSADPYPATVHPESIRTVARILQERRARVVMGDQSGIEHVLQDEKGIIKGSSEKCYKESGMGRDIDAKFVSFEKQGWHEGFRHFQSDQTKSWPKGFYVTKWIDKADHIINLPRLSTHGMGGVTLGFKNLVGILREDSRMNFHANGPYKWFWRIYSKGAGLDKTDDKTNAFFEKITEISLAVKDKLRLTLTTGTKAQVTMGPDKYIVQLGKTGLLPACVITPKTGLVFASQDPVASEALSIAYMSILYQSASAYHKTWQKILTALNGRVKELGKENVWKNLYIKHALALGLGSDDVRMELEQVPEELQQQLSELLKR